ncbi:H-2 class II histocompatibility antigen, A-U alpha chain-like [Alosa pseudoharengus]|uniref:H-2 class II histocompatibility antigen, A-U alpha chain-like n=1 Tax=Alosa pseudoharengus TaxID=34774 RepID=UPI003F88F5F3
MSRVVFIILSVTGVLQSEAQLNYGDEWFAMYSDTDHADELSITLEGDEVAYVDFEKKELIMTLPEFADTGIILFRGTYEVGQKAMAVFKTSLDILKKVYKNPPEAQDAPMSSIYPKDEVKVGSENTLICHVTGFYPPRVTVRWTKNNKNMTREVTLSRYHINKDETFTMFSTLKFTPQEGDMYTCTVEHSALDEPLTREWDVEVSEPSLGPSVFCGVGLTLGLLGVATGTFYLIKGNQCN